MRFPKSAPQSPISWLRLGMDCVLLALIVLALVVGVANARPQSIQPGLAVNPLSHQPAPAGMLLDNNTLAAMIAAENAALTIPVYFASLPLTIR